ncbi:RBBP9/YdeN family alpha/beta hydrolase [Sphingomonas morindae]|uniref:Alpha/beta hydrolase n=1 Tax=Sphingomonas morindae TaxID=1541170 RepID=A0ABY4X686_9SPHN|nr:alpha/beta hydrolase [Sphingomonas morindae]USI72345.1 alpha/beta hydrolase [Sphingomonas morindae]
MSQFQELVLPGLFDSGPDHWQSHWCAARPSCRRVELGQWDHPTPALWVSRLDRAVARSTRPALLIAHSLGCLAVAWWAAEASAARRAKVAGALLVAPPDVDRADAHPLIRAFAPAPAAPLAFPALLVASRDDPYASLARSRAIATAWHAEFVDAGALGHINADSRLGDWPEGRALLDRLIRSARPGGGPFVAPDRAPAPRADSGGRA